MIIQTFSKEGNLHLYFRTMKSGQGQGNVALPTTPLPLGSVGVTIGEPPSIDSPPALEVAGSVSLGSVSGSPAGSTSSTSYQATPSKRVPGKLALCTRCGTQSEDLSTCVRCKRKLPEDVKLLDDPAFKSVKPDSTDGLNKKALRGVRLPNKNKKRNNTEEPVCIALSDSEDGGDEDTGEAETIEDEDSGEKPYPGDEFDTLRTIVNKGTIEADRKYCLLD